MMRTTCLALLFAGAVLADESPISAIAGTWDVKTSVGDREMPAVLELSVGEDGKLRGVWKSMNGDVPLTDLSYVDGVLKFVRKTQGREIGFRATLADGKLAGAHTVGTRQIPATGRKVGIEELNDPAKEFERNSMRAVARDAFPVLDDPTLTTALEATIGADEYVIGVVVNKEAKAYPVQVMGVHELINDTCGKNPIAVSW